MCSRQHVVPAALPGGGRAAGGAAADNDAGAGGRGAGDDLLMLTLERRVWDLERVEDAHIDLLHEVRERARDADEAHLSFALQRESFVKRAVLLELAPGQATV